MPILKITFDNPSADLNQTDIESMLQVNSGNKPQLSALEPERNPSLQHPSSPNYNTENNRKRNRKKESENSGGVNRNERFNRYDSNSSPPTNSNTIDNSTSEHTPLLKSDIPQKDNTNYNNNNNLKNLPTSKKTRRRTTTVSKACCFCRSKHLKCDGERPKCKQCVQR